MGRGKRKGVELRALRNHPHVQGLLLVIVLFGAVVAAWPLVVSAFGDLGEENRTNAPVAATMPPKVASAEAPKTIQLLSAPAP